MPKQLQVIGIAGSRVVSSTISTANTTNHAAPSEDMLLSPTQIAVVSTASVLIGVAIVLLVVGAVSYYKRKQIAGALSRFNVAFVHPRELFSDPSIRPAHEDVEDIDEFGDVVAINEPSPNGRPQGGIRSARELEYLAPPEPSDLSTPSKKANGVEKDPFADLDEIQVASRREADFSLDRAYSPKEDYPQKPSKELY